MQVSNDWENPPMFSHLPSQSQELITHSVPQRHGGKERTPSSSSMVKNWAAEFKCSSESLRDDPCHFHRAGNQWHCPCLDWDRLINNTLANCHRARSLWRTCPCNSLQHIQMTKVSASCLNPETPLAWWEVIFGTKCQGTFFRKILRDFIQQFVTMAETRIHHFQPETEEQSKQYYTHSFLPPRRLKQLGVGRQLSGCWWYTTWKESQYYQGLLSWSL